MAKPKQPLLSFKARGSLGHALTYARVRGVTVAKRIPTPNQPRTLLQLYRRNLYSLALEWWRSLTPAQAAELRTQAAALGLPIYQYFMKVVLSTVIDHATRHELGGADQVSVAGLSGVLADDQAPQVHGPAKHTNVPRELFIPATEGYASGAVVSFWPYYSTLKLPDGVNAWFNLTTRVPDDFVAFLSMKMVWGAAAAAGNLEWRQIARYAAAGEVRHAHTENLGLGLTATLGNNIINVSEHPLPLTLANLAKGDYLGIYTYRLGTGVGDTLNVDVYVLGLLFTYTADQ